MAVLKLSQIAAAPAPPALTDTVIGVGGGTTDYQYTLAQLQSSVGALIPATSNLTFYVSILSGTIVGGSLYTDGTYTGISLTGGHGTATADIVVSGGAVTIVKPSAQSGELVGDVLTASAASIGGTGSGFTFTVTAIGSDSNAGTSAVSPYRTIQKAINTALTYNYARLYTATFNLADGIYVEALILSPLFNASTDNNPQILGNGVSNCTIDELNSHGSGALFAAGSMAQGWQFDGMTFTTDDGIATSTNSGDVQFGTGVNGCNFILNSATVGFQANNGSKIVLGNGSSFTISGAGATTLFNISNGATIDISGTITFSGTPAFTTVTAADSRSLLNDTGVTFSGAVTGKRFALTNQSAIATPIAQASWPGNSTGTGDDTSSYGGKQFAPGSDTQVAYNSGGVLSADSSFLYAGSGKVEIPTGAASASGGAGIWRTGSTFATGMSFDNDNIGFSQNNSAYGIYFVNGNCIQITSGRQYAWVSDGDASTNGTRDTGLARESAGVVKITNGGAGYGAIDASAYSVSGTAGISATITTAKVTPVSGANGSMTFVNGILTAQTQAT